MLAAVLAWVIKPYEGLTAGLLIVAGVLLFLRLSRWRSLATLREPIVGVLHLGYGWLAIAPVLMGAAILWPGYLALGPALHALTAGAAGTMTLAAMTRASLGHTGREIVADRWTVISYCCVSTGAFLRVTAGFAGTYQLMLLSAGGLVWSLAFHAQQPDKVLNSGMPIAVHIPVRLQQKADLKVMPERSNRYACSFRDVLAAH